MTSVNDGVMFDVVAASNEKEASPRPLGSLFYLSCIVDIGKDLQTATTLYTQHSLTQSHVTSTRKDIVIDLLFGLFVSFSLPITLPAAPSSKYFSERLFLFELHKSQRQSQHSPA